MMQPDDPPFLTVGTEVSAKYKGAFCEAKVNKVVKIVKVKVTFKFGLGSAVVTDECIKGVLKVGAQVKALHPDKNQHLDGIVNKIQDCSQYTVVFDDGDITTLRRSSLCLKSGRHFAESETLDQLPLTHPEHFGTPVVGGRRGRRSRQHPDSEDASSEEEDNHKQHRSRREEWESDIGKVVCVEIGDKKKQKDNWFPGLVVAPTAQDTVKIETKKDYLVRSFQDGRYYTVPKKEASTFTREVGSKVTQSGLRAAVEKALLYIDKDELPPHWDRDLLFGVYVSDLDLDKDSDSDTSDDEPREEKDHFVAQLYKFMEECGTPINKGPTIGNKDLDLYKLFKVVQKLGGFNRVMNQNQWKVVAAKMNLQTLGSQSSTLVKSAYKRYLQSFEDFYRKLGCTMVSNPRGSRTRHRSGRSLIRDCDKRPTKRKGTESGDSAEEDSDKKEASEIKLEEDIMTEGTKIEESKKDIKKIEMDKEEPKKEAKKIDVEKEEEKKEPERKKEEGKSQRNRTLLVVPTRTISPTTRERSKETKVLRPEGKLRNWKKEKEEDCNTKEPKEEEPKKKDIKEPKEEDLKKNELKEQKEEELKKKDLVEDEVKVKIIKDEEPKKKKIKTEEVCKKEVKEEEIKKKDSRENEPKTRSGSVREEKREETEESEEEIEKAQTRSLRNREEKENLRSKEEREKEQDALKKTIEKKTAKPDHQKPPDHQRSTSCNSTCSGSSSSSNSTCTSNTSNPTDSKNNSSRNKIKLSKSSTTCPLEELKKRGRKKKIENEGQMPVGKSLLPSHVPINIGDKLRVLYGPNNKESKVTYEAKVLEIEESGAQKRYYVHYLGWNTRYDEWVVRQRVAQNLTWCQARTKKCRTSTSRESDKKKEEMEDKVDKKEDKKDSEASTSSGPQLNVTSRRGRPAIGPRRESEKSETNSSARASTRSERANLSLSESPSIERLERRRSRRHMSLSARDTEDSDSEDYESGAESCPERNRGRRISDSQLPSSVSSSPGNLTPEPSHNLYLPEIKKEDDQLMVVPLKEDHLMVLPIKQEIFQPFPLSSCGKDIDLKAIESEMKGLDKPIKKEDGLGIRELSGRILTTVFPGSLTVTEKKKHDPRKPFDSPVKRMEIPVRLVPAHEIMGQIKPLPISGMRKEPLLEDDIYEFKEPEPFEFGEIRSRKECKSSRGVGSNAQEDLEPEAKVKKKGRPIKEGEEKSESDTEPSSSSTLHKRNVILKDTKEPTSFKRIETKDTIIKKEREIIKNVEVKKDIKDYSRKIEILSLKCQEEKVQVNKEAMENKEQLRIANIPCLQIKEPALSSDSSDNTTLLIDLFEEKLLQTVPTEHKDVKLEPDLKESHMIDTAEVVTLKILPLKKEPTSFEAKTDRIPIKIEAEIISVTKATTNNLIEESSVVKEVPQVSVIPVSMRPKPIAVTIDKSSPSQILTRIPSQPGHVLAQVVMTPNESKVFAKPVLKPSVDPCPEKTFILPSSTTATLLPIAANIKHDEKSDGKMMPFSQRQQHIFPHLLNRSETVDEKSHEVVIPKSAIVLPVTTPLPVTPVTVHSIALQSFSEPATTSVCKPNISEVEKTPERIKSESTVEESIEAVVLRARQDQMQAEDEKKVEMKTYDKRRRNTGRTKKTLSREFVPDTSEESDNGTNCEKGDQSSRQKRFKNADGTTKYSPAKRVIRLQGDNEKKIVRRCDEEERANDADEEDNESNFPPLKILSKEAVRRKKEIEGDDQTADTDRVEREKEPRQLKKKRRPSTTPKRSEESEEVGLGDLLCEETIPPGSPMPQDNLSVDSEPVGHVVPVKQEMPFASVPTGSSFSKRGANVSPHTNIPSNLQASLQQIHPSVCIQSVHKSASNLSQSYDSPPSAIQPNVTITSLNPKCQPPSLLCSKIIPHLPDRSISFRGPSTSSQAPQIICKSGITKVVSDTPAKPHSLNIDMPVKIQSLGLDAPAKTQLLSVDAPAKTQSLNVDIPVKSHSLSVDAPVKSQALSVDTSLRTQSSSGVTLHIHEGTLIKNANQPSSSAVIVPNLEVLNPPKIEEQRIARPAPLPNIDNTPPTTPESIISNLSDSPRRENEGSKLDDNSKTGPYSSEMDYDNKTDNFSEDSNTMDSSAIAQAHSLKRSNVTGVTCTQSHSEGWDTEDGSGNLAATKRHKRGSKSRVRLDEDSSKDSIKESPKCSQPLVTAVNIIHASSRRRRQHSISKGTAKEEECDTQGLAALSIAACSASGRSRYNFCQELDPELDAGKRITVLQSRMQELKRTYMQVKAELASVERRRKKFRKKEREKEAQLEES